MQEERLQYKSVWKIPKTLRKHHYLPGIFTYKVSLGIHTPRHESSS